MARTKRNAPSSAPSQAIWWAALYTRLSREDGDKPESDSIANQRALLEDFAARHPDLQVIGQYSDCLLYTSPSPRDRTRSRMPSSA